MHKIVILFSIVSWMNFVVSLTPDIQCDMKTDVNIDDCIKNELHKFSEIKNADCINMRFTLTNNNITKLPVSITDECNNPNTGICCAYIDVKNNTNLTLNGPLNVTILKLQSAPIDIPKNKSLLDTTELVHLELKNCNIRELYNETFSMLPNLKLLFLENNYLSTIPEGLFRNNSILLKVYLQNNNLDMVPEGLFENNNLLQKVYLQNNNLSTVPAGLFKNNRDLQEVYLENNNISDLPSELFTKNTNLMKVNLTNNNNLTEIVVYFNKSLTVHILNQTMNVSELCMDVNSTEVKITFTDSVNPNCTMFEKVEHTSVPTTTSTTNTTENSTEKEVTEFKKYAWLYFFSIILFQLIILAILIVLYIRDKDDVSQKID